MLWIKAFHIIFVVSWFAGLFYLPRIFVNLAMVPADSIAEHERLLAMGRKLYRFTMWISVVAIAFGAWLWLGYGLTGTWLYVKLALVAALVGYHHYCGRLLRGFAQGKNTRSHTWYRVFNELPVLGLVAIVILAVVKPF
jgi:putative membrane protein